MHYVLCLTKEASVLTLLIPLLVLHLQGHRRNASLGAGTAAVVAKLQEQLAALEGKNGKLMEQADLLRDQLAEKEMVMSRQSSFATKYDDELAKMKHDLLKAEVQR